MEYAILIISFVSGALFRRWWGGWLSPLSCFKRLMGFLLPLFITYVSTGNSYLSILMSGFVLFGWLMPFHGFGMGMGRWPKGRPLWLSYSVMTFQYGGLTLLSGLAWSWLVPNTGGLIYASIGCIIPLGYLVAWNLWETLEIKKTFFIDSPTAIGELFLGAVLIGGIPLSYTIAV